MLVKVLNMLCLLLKLFFDCEEPVYCISMMFLEGKVKVSVVCASREMQLTTVA